jgi:predicted nucleotidyltransferase
MFSLDNKNTESELYKPVIDRLLDVFKNRLKTLVLFGSQARKRAEQSSDHDIFLVIANLPNNLIKRQKQIRTAIWDISYRINTIAKTPEEMEKNLTPLIFEVCIDGICLYGKDFFEPYRKKALNALKKSGLQRKRIGREWYWQFDKAPRREWELTWEGFHEL